MNRDINFSGQPVFGQIIQLLDKQMIIEISQSVFGSEKYVKKLDGYKHLVIMLYGVFKHFDSLREIEIGMQAEANKLAHLGLDYVVRRSTLSDANKRRPEAFFAQVYQHLFSRYANFLADSHLSVQEQKLIKALYLIDSTTITLFHNILKGVGRHPKNGKKKGGIKVHTLMKYEHQVPMLVELTSAAKHDIFILKDIHLPQDSTIAMDRAYIDYAQMQRLTEEGVCYVTKMKKNLIYQTLSSVICVNKQAKVVCKDETILFQKETLQHTARRVELWIKDKNEYKHAVLLTNNFDLTAEELAEIYKRRWAIEMLYKQLKQNFQLHFFLGDSENAIKIQVWVTLIANLLSTVIKQMIKRRCAFSQVVTMIRLTLMYYINFVDFMENPNKNWEEIQSIYEPKPPPNATQFSLDF